MAIHTCTKQNPMRTNSDPADWVHPDMTEVPDSYYDSTMCDGGDVIGGPSVIMSCPHCEHLEAMTVTSRGVLGGALPELRGKPLGDNQRTC